MNAMDVIQTRHLFNMPMKVERRNVGQTPFANRSVITVTEARIDCERLRARLLPGGVDWVMESAEGVRMLDCRLLFQTDDGALLAMRYQGLRHSSPEVAAQISRGEPVDPAQIYHRVAIFFETAAPRYDAFNRMLAIGRARPRPDGGLYQVFEVL